ncbi:MAG TPA: winged helix DNA-binding protein [Sphingobium sp.]|nr:winged helix DNA-binding protein [Sphingobium sp.]
MVGTAGNLRKEEDERQEADLLERVRIIAERRVERYQYLPAEMFGEPAWDMLLDLYLASGDGKSISVSSACIASRAPATTALRWLRRMEQLGLVARVNDDNDRRRVYVTITDAAKRALTDWLLSIR